MPTFNGQESTGRQVAKLIAENLETKRLSHKVDFTEEEQILF